MMSDRKRELKYSAKSYSMDTDLRTVDAFPANHLAACSDSSHADLKSLCPCEDCTKDHGTPWGSKRQQTYHNRMRSNARRIAR